MIGLGLPLVVFGLQAQLVRDIPFARAGTAIAMAALYLAAARWLLARADIARPNAQKNGRNRGAAAH